MPKEISTNYEYEGEVWKKFQNEVFLINFKLIKENIFTLFKWVKISLYIYL